MQAFRGCYTGLARSIFLTATITPEPRLDLRLVEVVLPAESRDAIDALIDETSKVEAWHEPISDGRVLLRVLVGAGSTEAVMDRIQSAFGHLEGFRIIVFPVAASIPAPSPDLDERASADSDAAASAGDAGGPGRGTSERRGAPRAGGAGETEEPKPLNRISRAELRSSVSASVNVTWVFILMVALSAVVAALGMLGDNVAIVIGAMVIAPLLGPNVALSMATTLADTELGARALRANIIGAAVAFAVSLGIGLLVAVDPEVGELASRTRVGLADIALALAAGSAGALAFTSGVSATLIGVMVAVALLPPVVGFGLLLGAGHGALAAGAVLLVLTNVICINLAGVATFLVQGIRPRDWWEAERAKRATRIALAVWAALLVALVVVIRIAQQGWDAGA